MGIDRLPLKAPPGFEEWLGYTGNAEKVAFYWEPCGNRCCYNDGHRVAAGTLNDSAWMVFCGHPAVSPLLTAYDFGGQDRTAVEWLILDRSTRSLVIADCREAIDLLADQHPSSESSEPVTREDISEIFKSIQSQSNTGVSLEQRISQKIRHDAGHIAEMKSWLDHLQD